MIVITTMNTLPDNCYECPCYDGEYGHCQADKGRRYSEYRPFWCPLKEVEYNEKIRADHINVEMGYNMRTGEIITGETASTLVETQECICETEELERGDTLYVERSWDGGIEFNYIQPIKFCPVCGKKLPEFGAEHGRLDNADD